MELKDAIIAELEIIAAQQAKNEPGVISQPEQDAFASLHRLALSNRDEYEAILHDLEQERPELGINNQPIVGAYLEAFGQIIED